MRGPFSLMRLSSLLTVLQVTVGKVEIEELHVPRYVLRGRDVRLACQYTALGTRLYAVKWYKDKAEFYRFLPQNDPPQKTFTVTGFTVDMGLSDANAVQLRRLTPEATDSYMCEVISETPEFWTDHRRRNLTVVDVPEERPSISGHLPSYRLGDRLRVNCSSGPAMPAPHLTWFINGEEVGPHLIRAYQLSVSEYLKSSVLQLVSEVRHNFFRDGIMKLKCTSAIGEKYWQSTETLIGQLGDPRRGTPSQLAGRAGGRPPTRRVSAGLLLLSLLL
ncbi:uncharacterized protein LOC119098783 [Pollicipes pollicipes]|uniref:uncharacterized protein LOC119098783 n=1 Tax=Pollicipes pollicipes TaxID=41117 RepID=UPI001884FC77|nr:uncharacterized protein LOC119098783 [Pollicipes pollicipes]